MYVAMHGRFGEDNQGLLEILHIHLRFLASLRLLWELKRAVEARV